MRACAFDAQRADALDRVSVVVVERLLRVPVVPHLVIVPQDDLRDLGVEAAHVLVEHVVEMIARGTRRAFRRPSTLPA